MGDLDEKQLQDRDEEIKLVSGLDTSILKKGNKIVKSLTLIKAESINIFYDRKN